MASVGNLIGGLPKDIWGVVARHVNIQSQGRLFRVCQELNLIFDTHLLWESQAKKILTDFPHAPKEGWKAWVKWPSCVKFSQCSIDLSNLLITVPPSCGEAEVADNLIPLLEKIPGRLTCCFFGLVGDTKSWYRDEKGSLREVRYQNPTELLQYNNQLKDSTNRRFTAFPITSC